MSELTWDEVRRGAAALDVWTFECGLPLNPEDQEELVRSILYWSKSEASDEEIVVETKRRLDSYMQQVKNLQGPR